MTAQLSDLTDREKLRLIRRKARKAKTNLSDFFEFVMRSEETHDRMRVVPHQSVVFDFVQWPSHASAALVLPVEHAKTASMLAYGLFQLAQDTGRRGMVISGTQQQAKNVTNLMRQVIEREPRLRIVNPRMRPSRRKGDPWSDVNFTVDRDFGAKDPSFAAVGTDSNTTPGKRLDFCLADDLLNLENTRTPEQRKKLVEFVDYILKRRMVPGSRIVFCNTIFNPHDLMSLFMAPQPEGYGMPTLVMSAAGDVWLHNEDPTWPAEGLIKASSKPGHYRLKAHEPDPDNRKTLWPARFPPARLDKIRLELSHNPGAFNRTYLSDTHDESSARCKQEFIDACLKQAQRVGAYGPNTKCEDFLPAYGKRADGTIGPGEHFITITGVDLAMTVESTSDLTAMFTFECNRPDGLYRIVDIEYGRWDAMQIADKAIDKAIRFNSVLAVEAVGGQAYMLNIIRDKLATRQANGTMELSRYVQVEALMTSLAAKANPLYGVESLFSEMARGMWLFPNRGGVMPKAMAQFVKDCRDYEPSRHISDIIMACFMARWQADKFGALGKPIPGGSGGGVGSVLMR